MCWCFSKETFIGWEKLNENSKYNELAEFIHQP